MDLTEHPVVLGTCFIAETFVPGSSNFVAGHPKSGLLYLAAGLVAGSVIGCPAALAVGAASFAKAITGQPVVSLARAATPAAVTHANG
ncbi:MAG: DUF6072 family protein [Actinomycetota bacterium]